MPRRMGEQVPAAPFMEWLEQKIAQGQEEQELAELLGIPPRRLWRYRHGVRAVRRDGRNADFVSDTFPRGGVEDALHRADLFLWDVYPQDEFPELYPEAGGEGGAIDGWCEQCKEIVVRGRTGECLWCDGPTEDTLDIDWGPALEVLAGGGRI